MHNWLRMLLLLVMCSIFNSFVQAQGIYVNKKNGESIAYPAATFREVAPFKISVSSTTQETGVVATLQYEKIADMKTPRVLHQTFAVGDALVVVGGQTTGFESTPTAEIYQNGQWRDVSIRSAHVTGFTVTLGDGRVMVGGGSDDDQNNWSTKTDIFDPATMSFTAGPDMTVGRTACKAIATPSGVYVGGNSIKDDKVLDCYDGSSFKAVGDMDGRYNPYLFTDTKGNVYSMGIYDNNFEFIPKKANKDGVLCVRGDMYEPSSGKTYYYYYAAYEKYTPLLLPSYARAESSLRTDRNGYFVLTMNDDGSKYLLTEPCPELSTTYNHLKLDIPSKHPVTGAEIIWHGDVFANNAKKEAYIIGFSGTETEQTVHIISYNYETEYWTIASTESFNYRVASASWTMLSDGRLACTGGDTEDIKTMVKSAYIFTPPTAGAGESSSSVYYGVNVFKTDGSEDSYMESELESITTYEETFDERITQEIPVEYLSKMSAHMPIYSGNTPPNIEGTFLISPNVMTYTNIENDFEIGSEFNDEVTDFSAQNMTTNTVMFRDESIWNSQVMAYSDPAEAVVMGEGNNFTIFVIAKSTDVETNIWTKVAQIYSGTITTEGIKDCYFGLLMVDKDDDPEEQFIRRGDFRIFKDQDGLSTPTTWLSRSTLSIEQVRSLIGAQGNKLRLPSRRRMR